MLLIPLVTPLIAVLLGVGLSGSRSDGEPLLGGSAILVGVGLVVFGESAVGCKFRAELSLSARDDPGELGMTVNWVRCL